MPMLELNEVLLSGEERTLSLMAEAGQTTCLVGGTRRRRQRWLLAMLGLEPVQVGYISVDGEPLNRATAGALRALMGYVPDGLRTEGQVVSYEPPTVQDVFQLRANRHLPISNGLLAEEMRRTGLPADEARWLAVAVLLGRPILLVDHPSAAAADYLRLQAREGHTVVFATDDEVLWRTADKVIEI